MLKSNDPLKVQSDFNQVIHDLRNLLSSIKTNNELQFKEYIEQYGKVNSNLTVVMGSIRTLEQSEMIKEANNPHYRGIANIYAKSAERIRKVLLKLLDASKIEAKYTNNRIEMWEFAFQKGKLRHDFSKHFESILEEIIKIQKETFRT